MGDYQSFLHVARVRRKINISDPEEAIPLLGMSVCVCECLLRNFARHFACLLIDINHGN